LRAACSADRACSIWKSFSRVGRETSILSFFIMPIVNFGFAESWIFAVTQGCSSPLLFREDHTAGAALSGLPGWLSFLTLGAADPPSPAPLNSPSCARRCRAAPEFSASTLFSPLVGSLHDRPSGSRSLGPENPEVSPAAAPTRGSARSILTSKKTIRSSKASTQISPAETAPTADKES